MVRSSLFIVLWAAVVTWGCGNQLNETENQRACFRGGGIEACVKGGLEGMETGRGQPASKYLNHACIHRNAKGCFHLGQFYLSAKKRALALKSFSHACFVGSLEGCEVFLESDEAKQAKGDQQIQVIDLYEKACQLTLDSLNHPRTATLCARAGQDAFSHAKTAEEFAYAETMLQPACVAGAERWHQMDILSRSRSRRHSVR